MAYIQIIDDDDLIPLRPRDERTGELSDSVLHVRVLAIAMVRELRRKHRKRVLNPKSRQFEWEFNDEAFGDDVVDAAVQGWEGVKKYGSGELLPCERRFKLALPPAFKIQVVDLALGRETEGADATESAPASEPVSESGDPKAR